MESQLFPIFCQIEIMQFHEDLRALHDELAAPDIDTMVISIPAPSHQVEGLQRETTPPSTVRINKRRRAHSLRSTNFRGEFRSHEYALQTGPHRAQRPYKKRLTSRGDIWSEPDGGSSQHIRPPKNLNHSAGPRLPTCAQCGKTTKHSSYKLNECHRHPAASRSIGMRPFGTCSPTRVYTTSTNLSNSIQRSIACTTRKASDMIAATAGTTRKVSSLERGTFLRLAGPGVVDRDY